MNLWESPGFSGWKGIIISTLSRNLYSSSVFSIFKIKFEFVFLCLMVIHGFIAAGRANSTVHLYVKVWSSTLMGLKLRYALICTRLRIILSLFSSSPNNYEVLTTNHISKLLRTQTLNSPVIFYDFLCIIILHHHVFICGSESSYNS